MGPRDGRTAPRRYSGVPMKVMGCDDLDLPNTTAFASGSLPESEVSKR